MSEVPLYMGLYPQTTCKPLTLNPSRSRGRRPGFPSVQHRGPLQGYLAHKKTHPLGPYRRPMPGVKFVFLTYRSVAVLFILRKTVNPIGPRVFFNQENGERIQSVPFSSSKKRQGSNPLRFLKLRFRVHEVPLQAYSRFPGAQQSGEPLGGGASI